METDEKLHAKNDNFIQKADWIINKLKKTNDWVQTAMAVDQQKQQKYVDKFKAQAPKYKIKNKVRLTLKNIATATENKKLDAKQAKYTIFEDMGFHSFKLNTPPGIRNVFHVDRLRAASMDFFSPQISDDNRPGVTSLCYRCVGRDQRGTTNRQALQKLRCLTCEQ